MTEIDKLIEKYFDGNTSCKEERALRRFFTHEEVPPRLAIYRPLFFFFFQESEKHRHGKEITRTRRKTPLRSILRMAGSIAAGILLCVGASRLLIPTSHAENFVIIDGKRYTDPALVQAKAREALHNVGFSQEELNDLLFSTEP